jgi:hypothetical protein
MVEEAAVPHQNRVDPFGEIVALHQRGRWMGNRGILHEGTAIVRPWQHRNWIICATAYKDWRAPQWMPRRYTPLFFLDEAVALAAGHRPCALCRRPRWRAFVDAWRVATGDDDPRRDAIDRRLHVERRDPETRRQRVHRAPWPELPVGTFALVDGAPARVAVDHVLPWSPAGYGRPATRPARGDAVVLTPAVTVAVLAAGYLADADA